MQVVLSTVFASFLVHQVGLAIVIGEIACAIIAFGTASLKLFEDIVDEIVVLVGLPRVIFLFALRVLAFVVAEFTQLTVLGLLWRLQGVYEFGFIFLIQVILNLS